MVKIIFGHLKTQGKRSFCFQLSYNSITFVHPNQSVLKKGTNPNRAGHREVAVPLLLYSVGGIASPSLG